MGKSLCNIEAGGPLNNRLKTDFIKSESSLMPRNRLVRLCRSCRSRHRLDFVVTNCFGPLKVIFHYKVTFFNGD
jgi:hypothetical protein